MILRIALALLILAIPATGRSQDRGATVGGSVSVTKTYAQPPCRNCVFDTSDIAFAGMVGYQFSRVFSTEFEVTAVPDRTPPFADLPTPSPLGRGGARLSNPGGWLVIYTNNARIDISTTTTRVTPYFVAGGGAATERRTADFSYPRTLPPTSDSDFTHIQVASTSTDLAVTLGGGIGARVLSQLSVDVDVRLFRLFGSKGYYPKDHNVGRFGVGVRYRF